MAEHLEKSIVYKLLDGDDITKRDIQSLDMFGDDYIDKLLAAGQKVARQKVAEALTRDGMIETHPRNVRNRALSGDKGSNR